VVVDEIPVANARRIPVDERVRGVLRDMVSLYGPPALEAFASESGALRRAFQVNFERRHSGRYRSGRHIGVPNLRRFVIRRDLRLFQRLEVPDRLSYYFHLLVDVSPSMLRDRNVQKALAVGYAFTEALDRLRIPVDVSLYSSAISRVHDHRHDALEPFFGAGLEAGFGYFSSGTHEVEAIAFAKQVADDVEARRKLIVVITDGQPNNQAVARAGGSDAGQYVRLTLIPWLQRSQIDLLAIGIGSDPSYHANSVGLLSGWESIGVFMRLLDQIIAQSAQSHSVLWR
jgi:cobalamin biosynthesis protein CobT